MKRTCCCCVALALFFVQAFSQSSAAESSESASQSFHEVDIRNDAIRLCVGDLEIRATGDQMQYYLQASKNDLSGQLRLSGKIQLQTKSLRATADFVDYHIDSGSLVLSARSGNRVQVWRTSAGGDARIQATHVQIELSNGSIRAEGLGSVFINP